MQTALFRCAALAVLLVVAGCARPSSSTPAVRVSGSSLSSPADAKEGPTDADAPTEFTTTSTGLKYRILRKSAGPKPTVADTVRCHYRGTLDDGSEFDGSYKRGEPTEFPLNGVIPGWTEGLQLVGEGGKIELEIPSELGYGARGMPPVIPPGATLHFVVELVKVL